jgi:hypothetical protein
MNALQVWRPDFQLGFLSSKQSFPLAHKHETEDAWARLARSAAGRERAVFEIYSTENVEEPKYVPSQNLHICTVNCRKTLQNDEKQRKLLKISILRVKN